MATVDDKKIIFSMVGVSKTIQQNQKQILKNIYLSFYYGAKIGIIGLNGAGKSTLMKIIAGLETQYQGQVVFAPGYTVGYLPQDPQLDPTKTVKEVVQEGVQHVVDTLKDKTNLSAMKLTYAAKKGTFNGSFKVCELQGLGKGTKLKKCVVKVTGVVVNGVGYGSATCTKPAFTWSVTVK